MYKIPEFKDKVVTRIEASPEEVEIHSNRGPYLVLSGLPYYGGMIEFIPTRQYPTFDDFIDTVLGTKFLGVERFIQSFHLHFEGCEPVVFRLVGSPYLTTSNVPEVSYCIRQPTTWFPVL